MQRAEGLLRVLAENRDRIRAMSMREIIGMAAESGVAVCGLVSTMVVVEMVDDRDL
jgi:hypothetical protein